MSSLSPNDHLNAVQPPDGGENSIMNPSMYSLSIAMKPLNSLDLLLPKNKVKLKANLHEILLEKQRREAETTCIKWERVQTEM